MGSSTKKVFAIQIRFSLQEHHELNSLSLENNESRSMLESCWPLWIGHLVRAGILHVEHCLHE